MLQETSYTDDQLYTIMCLASQHDAYVSFVRGKLCGTVDDFFKEISASMRFPSYFGWNWDAFDECITDLEWLKFSGLLIVIDDFNYIFHTEDCPSIYRALLTKHINIAIDFWNHNKTPISVYLNIKH